MRSETLSDFDNIFEDKKTISDPLPPPPYKFLFARIDFLICREILKITQVNLQKNRKIVSEVIISYDSNTLQESLTKISGAEMNLMGRYTYSFHFSVHYRLYL